MKSQRLQKQMGLEAFSNSTSHKAYSIGQASSVLFDTTHLPPLYWRHRHKYSFSITVHLVDEYLTCLTLPHLCRIHFCWDSRITFEVLCVAQPTCVPKLEKFPNPLGRLGRSGNTRKNRRHLCGQQGPLQRGTNHLQGLGSLSEFQTRDGRWRQTKQIRSVGGEVSYKLVVKNIFQTTDRLIDILDLNQSIWNSTAHCRSAGMRRQQVKMEKVHSKNLSSQMVWLTS